ncbi:MAG: HlyC/CorC family transporter [Ignavibacteriaceae bacterium]|nr:HlyC/CorC family transporter [Ignavibacteriaceae bacterium]
MLTEIIILLLLLVLSAVLSSAEIAYIYTNRIKKEIESRKSEGDKKGEFDLNGHTQDFIYTVTISSVSLQLLVVAYIAYSIIQDFSLPLTVWTVLAISFFVFLWEIFPKFMATEYPEKVYRISSGFVKVLSFILSPLIGITRQLVFYFIKNNEISFSRHSMIFDKEDIQTLVEESEEAGKVEKSEGYYIRKVLDLTDQNVYEAMRPRTEIVGVEIKSNIDTVIEEFIHSGFSKLPVYEDNLDNIKGVIYSYDLFKKPDEMKDIIREIIFVPETKKSIDMLNDFLSKGLSIAIVVDEFGGTSGMVTMEDIIEELLGEIKDEYDTEDNILIKSRDDSYVASGKVEIDFINEKYNVEFPEGEYETIAGFITTKLGRIPKTGEIIKIDNFTFNILRSGATKVEMVKFTIEENGGSHKTRE